MIPVVFIIGVLNLIMGFALAVLLERQLVIPFPCLRDDRRDRDVVFEIPLPPAPTSPADVRDQLPPRWLDTLDGSGFLFTTCVDATAEAVAVEVEAYREELLHLEDMVRNALEREQNDVVRDAIQQLVALNEEWVERQHDAIRVLSGNRGMLGEHAALGHQLETVLLDQTALIPEECGKLANVDLNDTAAAEAIITHMAKFMTMAHTFRDVLHAAALLEIREQGRLKPAEQPYEQDELTGLQNSLGVERVFQDWWQADEQHQRLLSAALIDIDRLGELNSQLGTRAGDRILRTIANSLEQLVANDNGLDRLYRYAGQKFFVFFGDSGLRSAASKVEKIRQTIEATKLEYKGQQYSMTIRAGVSEVHPDDDTANLTQRLESLTETAKHAGRNRTGLEEPTGSGIIQPESLGIMGRVVKVE